MKKMIFSAIALTAFSFAGMANEVKSKNTNHDPCETHGQYAYRNAMWQTGSTDYAYAKYEEAKQQCEDAIRNIKIVLDSIVR